MTARPTREIVSRTVAVGGVLGAIAVGVLVGPDPIAVLAFAAGCVTILVARVIAGEQD